MSTPSPDPYFPNHGDLAYDVEHYDVVLDYKVDTNHLAGRATLTCRARGSASTFALDLHGLRVAKVTLDGAPPRRFRHRAGRLVIEPAQPLAAGASFEVVVTYSGHPGTVHGADDGAGWEELTDGVLVAGQPNGAPTWFPCNDRPSTKGTYAFTVATPPAYTTVANGTLVERHATSSRVVWRYEVREPMASYLATLQIGRYQSRRQAGSRVPVTIHAPASRWMAVDRALVEQPAMLRVFEDLFGPYPFDAYAVVVADDDLEIPLESQSLSTFGPNHMTTSWTNQRLVAHELAHQWFGNSLTAVQWSDIWLHEGFACYAEWIWSENSGRETAGQHAVRHWERLSSLPQDLVLASPGPIDMFDDRLYKRGALTLHALRIELGDDAFFSALKSWVSQNRYGSVTTDQFVAHMADHVPGRASVIRPLLTSWLYSKELPDWQ